MKVKGGGLEQTSKIYKEDKTTCGVQDASGQQQIRGQDKAERRSMQGNKQGCLGGEGHGGAGCQRIYTRQVVSHFSHTEKATQKK